MLGILIIIINITFQIYHWLLFNMSQNSDDSDFEDETKAGKRRIGQNDENWSKKKRATTRASTHAKKVGEGESDASRAGKLLKANKGGG